jgi:GNAT superfamily N-acetyltransferase
MQAHFRAGTLANLAIFLPLMRAFYAEDRHPFDESKARSALAELLEDSRWGLAWLIAVEGTLAGYVVLTFGYSLEFGGRDATLDELYLREAYRGKGIGKQALDHVIYVCREHGIQALHLEVEAHNRRAHAIYRVMGFAEDDSTLMTKVLSE